MPSIDPTYRLLALCARAEGHPIFYEQLKNQLRDFTAWRELPAQAEQHGMASLLWHHIQRAGINIPPETKQALIGLYLRHRIFNQAHTQVLLEINSLFEAAGIRPLVLKGLALAHQYYPDPALRPISDIDLLLNQADVLPALDLLAGAGFRVDTPTSKLLPKELTADSPLRDGLRVHVELHHFDPRSRSIVDHSLDDEFIGFDAPPQSIAIGDGSVYMPDPMDTLDYLFRHFTRHLFVSTDSNPLPSKWIADVVSLVEHHAETMDWDSLRKQAPALLNRLEVIYSLTPLPERLAAVIPIRQIQPPDGVGKYPQGWPQQVYPEWKRMGILYYLRRTFASPAYIRHTFSAPSNWWLRLYYGINADSVFWYGQVAYRMQVLKMIPWKFLHRA